MQGERKAIRDGFKNALSSAFNGDIFTKRHVDARDLNEYVTVYFNEGDATFDSLDLSTSAEVLVGYHVRDYVDDDQLDVVANDLYAALKNNPIAPDVLRGTLPSGFMYGDDTENEFTSIFLKFTVIY